ncbi:efflux RND transporter periplasmic adaptor subunit [Vibrio tasmaniensis]|uniref:efflux RND transporter periplasmic adaptor subunit n=1 Tax=Vibrio tasmaniensis TaxID=212663 RepID=UPI00147727E0|nr:efflux RND transporter periplasmic adaptor subunit [Vibrio tasmaniensis]
MFQKLNFAFLVALAAVAGLSGCSDQDIQKEEQGIRPVKLISITVDESVNVAKFPAIINDNRLVELSFISGGKIMSLPVKNAQLVKEGDVIATLDQRDLKNILRKVQAQYKSAEIEYQRALKLSKNNAVSKSVLQERLTERDVMRSQLDSAKQAISDSVLKAPFNGVIAKKMVVNGQAVSGAQTIVKFIGGDTLEASIDIPANYLAKVYQNEDQQKTTETFITLDTAPGLSIPANYQEATLLADSATQTYAVTFEFSAPKNILVLPGMNATIEMRTSANPSANNIVVPTSAIIREGEGVYVWVVTQDTMTVSKRKIEVADEVGETLTVTSGLQKGEVVVSAGAAYLHEGMEVREWK